MSAGTYRDELAEIQTFILLAEAEELIRQGEAELRAYRDQEAARAFIDAAEAQQWIDEHEDEEHRYNHNHDSKGRFARSDSGLTGSGNSGIIANRDSSLYFYPVSERALNAKLTADAFKDTRLNDNISAKMHDVLTAVNGHAPGTEAGVIISISGGKRSDIVLGGEGEGTVSLPQMAEPYVSIHNHASGETLSASDLKRMITHKNEVGAFVIGNNGSIYGVVKTNDFDWMGFQIQTINKTYEDVISELKESGAAYGLQYYQKLFR